MDPDRANPGDFDLEDPNLEEKLVNELKAQGIFDQFRKDCLSDVDTKVIMRMTFKFSIFISVISILKSMTKFFSFEDRASLLNLYVIFSQPTRTYESELTKVFQAI